MAAQLEAGGCLLLESLRAAASRGMAGRMDGMGWDGIGWDGMSVGVGVGGCVGGWVDGWRWVDGIGGARDGCMDARSRAIRTGSGRLGPNAGDAGDAGVARNSGASKDVGDG